MCLAENATLSGGLTGRPLHQTVGCSRRTRAACLTEEIKVGSVLAMAQMSSWHYSCDNRSGSVKGRHDQGTISLNFKMHIILSTHLTLWLPWTHRKFTMCRNVTFSCKKVLCLGMHRKLCEIDLLCGAEYPYIDTL